MAVLDIVTWPAKVLETKAEPVEKFDDALRSFVKDMHDTMDEAGGIGLAANQVGSLQRVLVIQIPYAQPEEEEDLRYETAAEEKKPWHDKRFTFINPEIVKRSGKTKYQEGCLSFPEIFDWVDRSAEVTVKAFDEKGKEFIVEADGLFSICLQHEIDHIDGIVFINRMSRLKSNMIKKKLTKKAVLEQVT